MQVSYGKLFEKIKERGITQKDFKQLVGIGGTTFNKLLNNDSITTNTICRICDYFSCMPEDIMEFIPDTAPIEDTQDITDSEQIPSEPSHLSPLELRVNELMQQTVKIQTELIEIQKQLLKQ